MGIEIIVAVVAGAIAASAGLSAGYVIAVAAIWAVGASLLFGTLSKKPSSGQPDFGGGGSLGGSPTYGRFGALQNTITDKLPVAALFGRVRVGGNVVWQSEPGDDVTQLIILGHGEIDDVEEIRINDRPWQQFSGVSVEVRYGTKDQGPCTLATTADPDVEGIHFRGIAHLAVKLHASDDLSGSATITSVVRGAKCNIYNEQYFKDIHPWASGDTAKPVNSTEDQANDGIFQIFQAPDNVRLAEIEVPLSWREGDQADEDNADWFRSYKAYLQLYRASASVPTGDVVCETSRIQLGDVTAKNISGEWQDHNIMRFNLPPNVNLTSGEYYAFAIRTTYPKDVQKKCIHVMGDYSSTTNPTKCGYLNNGVWTANATASLNYRINMYKANSLGWSNGPYWTRNPAAIVREIMLNRAWGIGKPSGDINDTDFGLSYNHFKTLIGDGDSSFEPRFEVDFAMDSLRPAVDQLEDVAASCLAYYVREGNRISMKCLASGDVAHSFGDGSSLDVNAYDNIKENSFRWRTGSVDDLANRTIVRYIEPGEKWNESTVEFNDRIDQETRDTVIPNEILFATVTRRSQAIRLGKYHQLSDKYAGVEMSWIGFLEASHVQIGDIVGLWHKAGLYEGKQLRVTSRIKNADGTIEFVGAEYYQSLFDDAAGIQAPRRTIPTGPNVLTSLGEVTGLTLTEVAVPQGTFGQNGDGRIVSNIQIAWDALSNDQIMRLRHYRVQFSIDAGASYTDAIIVGPGQSGALLVDVQIGKTYTIRVKTVTLEGISSNGTTASLLIVGKDEPPSDVTGFSVNLVGSELIFNWDPVQDVDLQSYEIRVGDTWETGAVIDTFLTGTIYRSTSVLVGTRRYHIKAVDYSGNYSTNSAEDVITITGVPEQNIVVTHKEWQRIPVHLGHSDFGTTSASGDWVMTNEFNAQYFRRALQPVTQRSWAQLEALGLTCAQMESNAYGQQFDQPLFTGDVTYETDPVDFGDRLIGTLILDHRTSSEGGGVSFAIEYSPSDDGITYGTYRAFTSAQVIARFVKFRVTISTEDETIYIRLLDLNVILDVPDISDEGLDVVIPASETTILFNVAFALVPRSVVATTTQSSTNKAPVIRDVTKTSFKVKLLDKTDAVVAGTINWIARGAGGISQ